MFPASHVESGTVVAMAQHKPATRVVPAVDRAARILALIEAEGRPMSITELGRRLDASKGTVRDILETLRSHGLLDRDAQTKHYRLGPQLVRLGASSRGGQDIVAVARPHLVALSDSQRENVVLLLPQGERLLIEEVFQPGDPRTPLLVTATPGRTIPGTAGACGKVMMAWSDAHMRLKLRQSAGKPQELLDAELRETRRRGYAISDEEFAEGVRGVSAPILGASGSLIGIVLLSGLVASFKRERFREVGAATQAAAHAISLALGGPGIIPAPAARGSDRIAEIV